jgi:hypothetical protein
MNAHKIRRLSGRWSFISVIICLSLIGCNGNFSNARITPSPTLQPTSAPLIPSTDALITFQAALPAPLPPGDSLYFMILDEVTGLDLNPKQFVMEAEDDTHFFIILPFAIGSMVEYRYQRQGSTTINEHLPDGRPVRYRLYNVEGPGIVTDTISRWADSKDGFASGELRGRIVDGKDGHPIPSIMVAAGGYQTYTSADGTFVIHMLPPGIHNVVASAIDGSYQPYQQGAKIEMGASTFANIAMQASELITATLIVSVPDQTPTDVPIRLAGNLYQFGNTYSDLAGGINSLVSRMPILNQRQDGRYSLTIQLPEGVDFRYKYTLGDGLWNAERDLEGAFTLRQMIVPDKDIEIQDRIDSWESGTSGRVTFKSLVPQYSVANNQVYIQFGTGAGWFSPLPMWGKTGPDGSLEWNFTVSNPIEGITNLKYRFCLDGECDVIGIVDSTRPDGTDMTVTMTEEQQTISRQVLAWNGLLQTVTPAVIPNVSVHPRGNSFTAGVAFQEGFRPIWETEIPPAISDIRNLHANWVFFQSGWTYTNFDPPTLEYTPGSDPSMNNLKNWGNQAHQLGMSVAIIPRAQFPEYNGELDTSSFSDESNWRLWFENYARMAFHYALQAEASQIEAIVIGDEWLAPDILTTPTQSLTFETLPYWNWLISAMRSVYGGKIFWAMSYPNDSASNPGLLNMVDEIYIFWSQPLAARADLASWQMRDIALALIDRDIAPLSQITNKPLVIAISFPSDSYVDQMNAYNAMLMAVNERSWLNGIVSMGYNPSLPIQDTSTSVHGKPASGVLWYWFPLFLGQ